MQSEMVMNSKDTHDDLISKDQIQNCVALKLGANKS